LHFVTDTGSPPHALVYKGDIHTKMENWLDASSAARRATAAVHPIERSRPLRADHS